NVETLGYCHGVPPGQRFGDSKPTTRLVSTPTFISSNLRRDDAPAAWESPTAAAQRARAASPLGAIFSGNWVCHGVRPADSPATSFRLYPARRASIRPLETRTTTPSTAPERCCRRGPRA